MHQMFSLNKYRVFFNMNGYKSCLYSSSLMISINLSLSYMIYDFFLQKSYKVETPTIKV